MKNTALRILLVEDDEDDYIMIQDMLGAITLWTFDLHWESSYNAALEETARSLYDVYLIDYRLGEDCGLDLVREMVQRGCNTPIILITGRGDYGIDMEAMRSGAADYLVKGQIDAPLLERSIRYAVEHKLVEAKLIAANRQLKQEIEERKQAEKVVRSIEKQLLQAQKIEALAVLAGGIAHDFKNILVPITLNTELVLCDPGLSGANRELLEQVLDTCRRAKRDIKHILTFSHYREERLEPLEMRVLVEETINPMQMLLLEGIELKHSFSIPRGHDRILADKTQIQQVIMNLCNNASDAISESGGTIEVSLAAEELDSTNWDRLPPGLKPGSYVKLSVRDTGHGMDSAIMESIFDPFFTTKAPGKGTGLGLAIACGIVNKHGGAIRVSSQPGRGALFDVFLPRIEDIEKRSGPIMVEGAPVPKAKGSERIFFVDDEEAVCESVTHILRYLGYEVTTAGGGPEALGIFRASPEGFDLVITDYAMPGLTGVELSRAIKQVRPNIPIVLCTAFQGVSAEVVQAAGIHEVISKPILMHEIAQVTRRVLDETSCIKYT